MNWAIKTKGYSQRRVCGLVGLDPRICRYRSTRPDDADLRQRLRELASVRRRFGYRRLHILLKREGWIHKSSATPISFANASRGVL